MNETDAARELGDSTTRENYVARAVNTECPYGPVQERFGVEEGDVGLRLAHMSLGIANEIGELHPAIDGAIAKETPASKLLVREELGDLAWYSAGVCSVIGLNFNEVASREPFDPSDAMDIVDVLKQMDIGSGSIAEQTKKHVFYGKLADKEQLRLGVIHVVDAIQSIALFFDLDFDKILQDNIAKLATRFPDRFTELDAINRDKDAEYEAMEK